MEGILPLLCLYTTLGVAFSGGMFACFREVMVVVVVGGVQEGGC